MSDHDGSVMRLLEQYGVALHALLVRITLREEVAEDLLQDLFLRLRTADGFAAADNQYAFARTTAMRLAFDWRRRQQVRQAESLDGSTVSTYDSPLTNLIDAEQFEQVLEAMADLAPADCEIITMRYLQQTNYEEIADELGCSVHQARARCSKAMQRLRAKLKTSDVEADHAES